MSTTLPTAYTAEDADHLCADGIQTNRIACEQSGMNDFINKPVSLDILQQVMHRYMPHAINLGPAHHCVTDTLWQHHHNAARLQALLADASATNVAVHTQRIPRQKSECVLAARSLPEFDEHGDTRRRVSLEELPCQATGLQLFGLQP